MLVVFAAQGLVGSWGQPVPHGSDGSGGLQAPSRGARVVAPSVCKERPWLSLSCCVRPRWVLEGMITGQIP